MFFNTFYTLFERCLVLLIELFNFCHLFFVFLAVFLAQLALGNGNVQLVLVFRDHCEGSALFTYGSIFLRLQLSRPLRYLPMKLIKLIVKFLFTRV